MLLMAHIGSLIKKSVDDVKEKKSWHIFNSDVDITQDKDMSISHTRKCATDTIGVYSHISILALEKSWLFPDQK